MVWFYLELVQWTQCGPNILFHYFKLFQRLVKGGPEMKNGPTFILDHLRGTMSYVRNYRGKM
jgi:hypothetical protein